ncbi:MAG: hypothetical protein ACYCZ8_18625 [Acidimicrobiales bacterium]
MIFAAAPLAVSVALTSDVALSVAAVAFAPRHNALAVAMSGAVSIAALVVALATRGRRAFLTSALALALACALADLPVHRDTGVIFAAIAGGVVVVFAEAVGAALESPDAAKSLGHPGRSQALRAGTVAVLGGAIGWLILSLAPELSDLGLAALGVGVVAAVCVMGLAALLAGSAVSEHPKD